MSEGDASDAEHGDDDLCAALDDAAHKQVPETNKKEPERLPATVLAVRGDERPETDEQREYEKGHFEGLKEAEG